MTTQHRGGAATAENYKGIPVHAAPGVHQAVVDALAARLPKGARVADIGAGQGALSQRLHDAGFSVCAIDLSVSDWMAPDVACHACDLDRDWQDVAALGPFDAIAAVEVIEHLENPRDFLRKIVGLAGTRRTFVVLTTPNPCDTFSATTLFTRGYFNWFSPQHYFGGGHISILPFWLIDQHFRFLGVAPGEWSFHSPFRHPSKSRRMLFDAVRRIRGMLSRSGRQDFFDGETALTVVPLNEAGRPPP